MIRRPPRSTHGTGRGGGRLVDGDVEVAAEAEAAEGVPAVELERVGEEVAADEALEEIFEPFHSPPERRRTSC